MIFFSVTICHSSTVDSFFGYYHVRHRQTGIVCVLFGQYALIRSDTGDVVFDYQYVWIWPEILENGWFYAWIKTDDRIGEWDAFDIETVYINLDGQILHAPDGYYFSEEVEPIIDGKIMIFEEKSGKEAWFDLSGATEINNGGQ